MSQIGFIQKEINFNLYPDNHNDLKSNWLVNAPVYDSINCVEIDNKYLLSIGAHAPHVILLFSKNNNLSYLNAQKISNVLSFLLDTVVQIGVPQNRIAIRKHYKGMKSFLKLKGNNFNDFNTIEHVIEEKYDLVNNLIGDFHMRTISNNINFRNMTFGLKLPHDEKLNRAIMTYKQGLLSFEPYGQILNYWRVLEAITTNNERIDIFKNYSNIRVNPIYAYNANNKGEIINLIPKYKKYIKPYYNKLIGSHRNPKELAKFFYKNRRCSIAHSKNDVLQETEDVTLASLFKDSLLLKIIARCAIENYWKNI